MGRRRPRRRGTNSTRPAIARGGLRCRSPRAAAHRRCFLLVLLHTERRAIVGFWCIRPYHIIALDASSLTVSLAELEDARLRAELLLAVLGREDVLQGIFILAAPDAGAATDAASAAGRCSVAPRRAATAGRQFAGSPSGTAGVTVAAAAPPVRGRFRAVVATAAGYVVAVAIGRTASRCGHYKVLLLPSTAGLLSQRTKVFCNPTETEQPPSIDRGFVLFAILLAHTKHSENVKFTRIKTVSRSSCFLLANSDPTTMRFFLSHSPAGIDFLPLFSPLLCMTLSSWRRAALSLRRLLLTLDDSSSSTAGV